jgi:hypothetical protein
MANAASMHVFQALVKEQNYQGQRNTHTVFINNRWIATITFEWTPGEQPRKTRVAQVMLYVPKNRTMMSARRLGYVYHRTTIP